MPLRGTAVPPSAALPSGSPWWISAALDATYGYRSIQTGAGAVPRATRVHVAAVYDPVGNQRRLYIDGEVAAGGCDLSRL